MTLQGRIVYNEVQGKKDDGESIGRWKSEEDPLVRGRLKGVTVEKLYNTCPAEKDTTGWPWLALLLQRRIGW